jgi:excinuclease ABC subunit B
LERRDTIVVASVAAIYGLSDPDEYRGLLLRSVGETSTVNGFSRLIEAQYTRITSILPGTFRVHGDIIDIAPMSTNDFYIRIDCFGDEVESIAQVDRLSGEDRTHYATYPILSGLRPRFDKKADSGSLLDISVELEERLKAYFKSQGKLLEAERLEMRTRQDMEASSNSAVARASKTIRVTSINVAPGQRPWTLVDYFPKDFLLLIDESTSLSAAPGHVQWRPFPETNLVDYGFRLPSALDNRPLNFHEFEALMPSTVVCTSATPGRL